MAKQKQQTISHFFSPKPQNSSSSTQPKPKITTTVSFSPSKHILKTQLTPQKPSKRPKPTPITDLPSLDPTLHQKFLNKLLEPSIDELEQLGEGCNSKSSYTPLEKQVVGLKLRYPDVLLMIEVGYKYRFFGEDAEKAAKVLGIFAFRDRNFVTASVPTFRLHFHVKRLVSAGYKVGVVKQTETAAIKKHGENKLGPFGRELERVYTKATLDALECGDEVEECGVGGRSSYLVSVVESGTRIGAVGVEVSTGDVVYGEFEDGLVMLESLVFNLLPVELLVGRPVGRDTEKFLLAYAGPASNVRVEYASQDCFGDSDPLAEIMSLYQKLTESSLPNEKQDKGIMAMPELAIQALGLAIRHLKQFGLEGILCLGASFRPFSSNMEMTLSANTLQQLEVLRNNSDGSDYGSLLQCMNHTVTLFGSRLFRHWVSHPLCDRSMLHARLNAVSEILESMEASKDFKPEIHNIISSVLTTLAKAPDVQRGITRIFHGTATASEFISVIQAILLAGKQLQKLHTNADDEEGFLDVKTMRSVLLRKLILTASSSSVISIGTELLSALNKEAADQRDLLKLFIVAGGKFQEVGEARAKTDLANEKLDQFISLYRKELRMRNLEFMSVSGVTHLIEVPLDTTVPSDWVKVNSTKKTVRYHPPEVLKALDQLTLANEELSVVCRDTWASFLKTFSGYYSEFQSAVQALASLDCLNSLATLSRAKNYTRPVFVGEDEPVQIHITSGRHPVMENILQDSFVPNDANLHANGEYCQIVTGPNMGGKSCYIRQVALICLMAQVGSYVPAASAKLHVLDGIYTRIGASDSIQLGRSTFLEELSETSHILQHCTSRSLVIIDELGRGTSTHDGVAIAYATLHYLLEHKKCMVLFVTHYPGIVDIRNEFPGSVGAYYVSYLTPHTKMDLDLDSDHGMDNVNHDDVTYLYKLVPGVTEKSFGFKVAQLAQLPSSCITRAISMAARLELEVSKKEKCKSVFKYTRALTCTDPSEDSENPCATLNSSQIVADVELAELEKLYVDIFSALSVALQEEDDDVKRYHYLKHAKSLANKLLDEQNRKSHILVKHSSLREL